MFLSTVTTVTTVNTVTVVTNLTTVYMSNALPYRSTTVADQRGELVVPFESGGEVGGCGGLSGFIECAGVGAL